MKFQHIKIIVILLAFVSCEKDFASIDSEVVNTDNAINFSTNIAGTSIYKNQIE